MIQSHALAGFAIHTVLQIELSNLAGIVLVLAIWTSGYCLEFSTYSECTEWRRSRLLI